MRVVHTQNLIEGLVHVHIMDIDNIKQVVALGNLFIEELLRKKLVDLFQEDMKYTIRIGIKLIIDHRIYQFYPGGYIKKYIEDNKIKISCKKR